MSPDFNAAIKDLHGNPIQSINRDKDGAATVGPATLGSLAVDALANAPATVNLSNDEKIQCFKLAKVLLKSGTIPVNAEGIVLIKRCIGAAFSPAVVGACFAILDPSSIDDEAPMRPSPADV